MTTPEAERIAAKYLADDDLSAILPINDKLSSAREETMISLLGHPEGDLTTKCNDDRASKLVKRLLTTKKVAKRFSVSGIAPAVESLKDILHGVFAKYPDLEEVLSTDGMLCVRMRKPTSGAISTKISNHSWGTAIDFKIVGHEPPGNTRNKIPHFISILVPYFNGAGWYSGIAFHDTMHFEVSEEKIREWSSSGKLA